MFFRSFVRLILLCTIQSLINIEYVEFRRIKDRARAYVLVCVKMLSSNFPYHIWLN